jgi:hypothetical protein
MRDTVPALDKEQPVNDIRSSITVRTNKVEIGKPDSLNVRQWIFSHRVLKARHERSSERCETIGLRKSLYNCLERIR